MQAAFYLRAFCIFFSKHVAYIRSTLERCADFPLVHPCDLPFRLTLRIPPAYTVHLLASLPAITLQPCPLPALKAPSLHPGRSLLRLVRRLQPPLLELQLQPKGFDPAVECELLSVSRLIHGAVSSHISSSAGFLLPEQLKVP